MNITLVCIAAALVCALGPTAARAEQTSVMLAATAVSLSSNASASIAGLSNTSLQTLPGFPAKPYRDGYREGRVKLSYVVNADGSVGAVEVLEAFPVQVFTRTATNAVAAWRFTPIGVDERRTVEIRFIAE